MPTIEPDSSLDSSLDSSPETSADKQSAKIVRPLARAINQIRYWGVPCGEDFWTRRVLEFNNLISAGLGVLCCVYVLLFLALGQDFFALMLIPFTLGYLICPLLNRQGFTLASRLLFTANYLVGLTVLHSISGKELYLNLLYLVFISRVYLIIRDSEAYFRWLAVAFAAMLFLLTEMTGFPYLPSLNFPPETVTLINRLLLPTLIAVFLSVEVYAYHSQKKWEKQLIDARDKAEEAAQVKSKFLSMMSHEIRTPLNGLIGTLELMDKTNLNSQQSRSIKTIEYASDHLCSLINNILDYNRLEARELHLVKDALKLPDLLANIIELYSPMACEQGLELSLELPKHPAAPLPEVILSDETRLSEVLCNLVSNALKYTEKGKVTLKVSCEGLAGGSRAIRFEVVDTGIGIPRDKLDEIFYDFYQIDDPFRRKQEGTGLGLAICKNILTLLNSRLYVESRNMMGSRFWFSLNCEVPAQSPSKIVANDASPQGFPGKRVLVVDDNKVNLAVASGFLRKLQFEVFTAANGDESIAATMAHQYDLVLMDIHMPGMDGFEATEQIRSCGKNQQTPVFALTADVSILKNDRLKSVGMNGLISKPIKLQHLNDTLEEALN